LSGTRPRFGECSILWQFATSRFSRPERSQTADREPKAWLRSSRSHCSDFGRLSVDRIGCENWSKMGTEPCVRNSKEHVDIDARTSDQSFDRLASHLPSLVARTRSRNADWQSDCGVRDHTTVRRHLLDDASRLAFPSAKRSSQRFTRVSSKSMTEACSAEHRREQYCSGFRYAHILIGDPEAPESLEQDGGLHLCGRKVRKNRALQFF